jgi:putative ABC transport system ATP-binding protein
LNAIIEARNLVKNYAAGDASIPVLRGVSFDVSPGEFVAIVGPSGNGKTTLLNMITGIDHPTSGAIHVNGQLLAALSLVQNVILPMDFMGTIPARQRRARALALLEQVGLADQADKLPSAVSGGQQQRAAIARALANDPPLVVADEPTGNLDARTSAEVFDLFARLAREGKTLVMVTHNDELARQASRVLEIVNGQIVRDQTGSPGIS